MLGDSALFLTRSHVVLVCSIRNITHVMLLCKIQNSEFLTNQHRDTLASHISHYDQLSYYAVAQNESIGRVRCQMLEKMVQPCGP